MVQTLYGLMAIFFLAVITLHMNRAVHGNEQKMILNELATDVIDVGAELLDEIGKYPFDPHALPINTNPAPDDPSDLLDEIAFGTAGCTPGDASTNYQPAGCLFMSDFDGRTGVRVRRVGESTMTYTIESIVIRYVTETSPHLPSGTKTFAREATVTLSSPLLYIGSTDNPVVVEMSRVYTYPNL